MALSTQPYKGTRDFYPKDMRLRKWMFGKLREAAERFGYEEYDGPMLEPFELYAAKTGEEIVNQQLYWMMDRGERKLAVRPEMTPTLARMVAAQIHELPKPIRFYSIPNLWRYERPQRGRLREHWQLNVDVLGGDPLLADAEILTLAYDLMRGFGGESKVSIKINNRRVMDQLFVQELKLTPQAALAVTKAIDARAKIGEEKYRVWLDEIGLSAEHRQRLDRFFKSEFKETARDFRAAGGSKAVDELESLFELLQESGAGHAAVFDPTVMRGMDYYTGTVFEMYDTSPENNRAMFGGGRYDNLIGLFGNNQLSGVGFGMGDVTLQHFLETHKLVPEFESAIDVFLTLPAREFHAPAEELGRLLRSSGLRVVSSLSTEGFSVQLKAASRRGARYTVLFGEAEWAQRQVMIKDMAGGHQHTVTFAEAHLWLTSKFSKRV